MALAGSIMCRVHRALDLEFVWNAAQDPAAGGSWIYWHTILRAGADGWIQALPGSAWSVRIDGQAFSGRTDISVAANSAKELASGKVFLKHDAFGEKSFDFSFSQVLNITFEGVYTGEVTGGGSAVLDRIDPNVTPVLDKSEVFLGDSLEITPKGPIGATYRLRYAMGGGEGIIAENVNGTVSWVVPEELGRQIPYTDRGILRILCQAYRDGTPFGREREAAVTALVPERAVPTVEDFRWWDVSEAAALGVLLQNVSRLEAEASCQGAMGSHVVTCRVTLAGKPLGLLREPGQQEILVTVTDSRARTGVYRAGISVLAYEVPRVRISAHRCLEDGTADDTGSWARIRLEAQATWLGGGEAYVKMDGGEVLREPLAGAALGERVSAQWETVVSASEDLTHAIEGYVFDGLRLAEHAMALSTAYCTMDVLCGGRGIAFGTVATAPGFVCAMDARFTGSVILPDGTDLMERLGQLTVGS